MTPGANGILEKDGRRFAIQFFTTEGNRTRETVAQIIATRMVGVRISSARLRPGMTLLQVITLTKSLGRKLDAAGEAWAAIVHSHIDCGAYFSSEDIRNAAPDGDCIYPQLAQLVVDARAWGIEEARAFRWDAAHRAFVPAGHYPDFKCAR